MKQYVCSVCGYVYDEAKGVPEKGIAPGTRWEELPQSWVCPWCGAGKGSFREKKEETETAAETPAGETVSPISEEMRELSPMEMSVICSNLAQGCEKQYLPEAAEKYRLLAEFFRKNGEREEEPSLEEVARLVKKDLEIGYPYGHSAASAAADRGALRSLVWSEKVTRMLDSLLDRYETEGPGMFKGTGVFVCTVCGFIYVGDIAPELCPVCKVPGWKFERVEGGTR